MLKQYIHLLYSVDIKKRSRVPVKRLFLGASPTVRIFFAKNSNLIPVFAFRSITYDYPSSIITRLVICCRSKLARQRYGAFGLSGNTNARRLR